MGNYVAVIATATYNAGDGILNFMSYYCGMDKPTVDFAFTYLEIPIAERDAVVTLIQAFCKIPDVLITPAKLVNDKKFSPYGAETPSIFNTSKDPPSILYCDKAIIYIAKHLNNIVEPAEKRIIHNVMINKKEYDVPTSLWYTLNMDKKKLCFYIHISTKTGYKGILFATKSEDIELLNVIKKNIESYYIATLGDSSDSEDTIGDL